LGLGIETEILEFKKSTGELKEAMNSICAILNKHQHGELYFGVRPDGMVIGQIVTEESLREVSQKIGNFIEPKIYPEIQKVNIEGRDCIYVKFEGNQVPYFAYGVAKIRVADEDLTMSPQELAEFIRRTDKEENRWENRISNKTIDDVDEALLQKYTNQAHSVGRIAIEYTDKKTVLNQLELSEGECLINAGKALFADDLLQDIQMAIFATTERTTFNDIQRYHGPVLNLVDIAENYIKSNIHWKVEFTGDLQRTEIPEIPVDAIREALLNSFCHKDYETGQSNEVAIYKDRIEIYNPGAFPEGYEPQDFIDRPERPIRRNPRIARILYYSKDVESFGTGLRRIAETCNAAGVRFEFKKLKSGFVVCFYRLNEKADKKPIKADRQSMIIEYIKNNGSVSNKEARELLSLADSTTKRVLKEMVNDGLLEVKGEKKSRRYYLK
jgi:ATP-dependent DNA helicase RecG